jgi:vitamin K-dependent gamma-carboxylase
MNKLLFKQIDNTGLVLFRVVFGLLISIEAFGAIATGWVRRTFVEPDFTFNFIGFEFLQPLVGSTMYFYFVVMGVFGLMIMLGYKYRLSMVAYALMWSAVYLLQKSSYNNHYYLMMLLCWVMAFLPAHGQLSLDARFSTSIKSSSMPRWCLLALILQVWLVYTFASIAKFYPDWLNGTTIALFMESKKTYWLIGPFLQLDWVQYAIIYVGILFDFLIVPLLLWKRTRMIAFVISVFFHLFNSFVFLIGIFPYMSIAFALFFFSSETLKKRFIPIKYQMVGDDMGESNSFVHLTKYNNILIGIFSIYFIFQMALPLRHWFFIDDVLWTEEGHRLSWRMMLRSKSGSVTIWVVDKECGERYRYNYNELLKNKQKHSFKTKPDLIWQLAQRIKDIEAKKGIDAAVYVDAKVRVNGGVFHQFIDPEVDLAAVKWQHFKHHEWILPSPADYHKKAVIK